MTGTCGPIRRPAHSAMPMPPLPQGECTRVCQQRSGIRRQQRRERPQLAQLRVGGRAVWASAASLTSTRTQRSPRYQPRKREIVIARASHQHVTAVRGRRFPPTARRSPVASRRRPADSALRCRFVRRRSMSGSSRSSARRSRNGPANNVGRVVTRAIYLTRVCRSPASGRLRQVGGASPTCLPAGAFVADRDAQRQPVGHQHAGAIAAMGDPQLIAGYQRAEQEHGVLEGNLRFAHQARNTPRRFRTAARHAPRWARAVPRGQP